MSLGCALNWVICEATSIGKSLYIIFLRAFMICTILAWILEARSFCKAAFYSFSSAFIPTSFFLVDFTGLRSTLMF